MKSSKLILLLQALQHEELRWMAKWVRSPYYNNNELVISLFDYLRKYHPHFDSPRIEKEQVFQHLLPGEKFDDRRIRLLMFRLSDLIEEFIVAQRLKADRFQHKQLLVAELGDRHQYNFFEKKNKELTKELEKTAYKNENYYLQKWQLQYDHFFHTQISRYRFSAKQMSEIMISLDAFYLLSKMRYGTELRNRQNILTEEHEIVLLQESREAASKHPLFSQDKVFQVYGDVLLLMEDPQNEEIFLRLEDNGIPHFHLFPPNYQSILLRYMINSSIQLYTKGKAEYLRKQFNLFQLGLEKDLFIVEGGNLSDTTFLNIIVTGSALGEVDWAENFIHTYSPKLAEDRRENAVNLGNGYLRFAQKDFKQSISALRGVESSDIQYLLRLKSLSLRNYFELFLGDDSYYELVVYESKAFEKFLRRNVQISKNRVKAYLNFTSTLRRIATWKTNLQLTERNLNNIQAELEKAGSVIAKQWILEKVGELRK